MAVKEVSREVARVILVLLATGALLTTALMAPNALQALKLLPKPARDDIPAWRVRWTLRRLRSRGMVTWQESGGAVKIVLTEKGRRRALQYRAEELRLPRKGRWDGKWRLVFFDIPNSRKTARDALRQRLQELGMYRMQESVFVYPFPCEDEVDFLTELFEVTLFVNIAVVDRFSDERELRRFFRLRKV